MSADAVGGETRSSHDIVWQPAVVRGRGRGQRIDRDGGEELLDEGFTARSAFGGISTVDSGLFLKTRRYEPEEEVRILRIPRGQPHIVPFEPTLLRWVILGRNMADEHRRTIREWCRVRVPDLLAVDE